MPHSQSFSAIVLKTYDVGEADRFCILFTRENGRMAARASGARRLKSRLGGLLLPLNRVNVELKEGSGGWIVAGVSSEGFRGLRRFQGPDVAQFLQLEEGIELLLRLVSDEGALPDVFDATIKFIEACNGDVAHASLGYSFALLHHLGYLPEEGEIQSMIPCMNSASHSYMRDSRAGLFQAPQPGCALDALVQLRSALLESHIAAPLKAHDVIEAM